MKIKWDSYFAASIRILLGIVLLYSGSIKLANVELFVTDLHNFQLVPENIIRVASLLIPFLELILGLFLFFSIQLQFTLHSLTSLLILFTIVLISKISEGVEYSCGCFGDVDRQSIGIHSIIRNIVLITITLVLSVFYETSSKFKSQSLFKIIIDGVREKAVFLGVVTGCFLCIVLTLQNVVLKERLTILTKDYRPLKPGDNIKSSSFTDANGRLYTLPADSSDYTVIYFMKKDCTPCELNYETWKDLAKQLQPKNIKCYGILIDYSSDQQKVLSDSVKAFTFLLPAISEYQEIYRTHITPQTLVIKRREVFANWAGKFGEIELKELISKIGIVNIL